MADNANKTEIKKVSKWASFKAWMKKAAGTAWLRMQLLWIWFIKNIMVVLQIALWALILITLFDPRITGDTPFFRTVFAPIILIKEDALAQESSAAVWFDVITAAISTCLSVYCVIFKTKSIALADIKSKNLKIALIQAGMYFDENGKLCKKVESVTKLDVNEDGKVGDVEIKDIPTEGVIKGSIRAGKELVTILTADLDSDKDGKLSADKAIADADLEGTVDAIGEDGAKESQAASAEGASASDGKEGDAKTNKIKAAIESLNSGISSWWRSVMESVRDAKNPKLDKEGSEIGSAAKKEETAPEAKAEEAVKKVEIVSPEPEKAKEAEKEKTEIVEEKASAVKADAKEADAKQAPAQQRKGDSKMWDIIDTMK